jgi:hypothetical protein
MSYSCSDFFDDIINALDIDTDADGVDEQADLCIAEIERLQKCETALNGKNLDHIIVALVLMQDIDAENGRDSDANESSDLIELLQQLKPKDDKGPTMAEPCTGRGEPAGSRP